MSDEHAPPATEGTTATPPGALHRALDVFVFAPIGIGRTLADACPSSTAELVERGHDVVEPYRRRLAEQTERFRHIGEVTVQHGPAIVRHQLRRRAAAKPALEADATAEEPAVDAGPVAEPVAGSAEATPAAPAPESAVVNVPRPALEPGAIDPTTIPEIAKRRDPSALSIPGYDELSASQVVERLAGLATTELDAIRDYETAGRGRKTILARIDQLVP